MQKNVSMNVLSKILQWRNINICYNLQDLLLLAGQITSMGVN